MNTALTEKDTPCPILCPVCTAADVSILRETFDDRYGQPDLFTLVTCKGCGHVMTSPRLAETDLGLLYGTYYPRKHVKVTDIKRQADLSATYFAGLKRWWMGTDNQGQYSARRGESMLDIGCGSGLSLLEAQALGASARGVEADPNVERLAQELKLHIHIGSLFDEPFPGERFDLVTLNQVIEHVPEPDRMLRHLRNRLSTQGRLVLVLPNVQSFWSRVFGARWINWHVPYHLHHFHPKGFAQLAERCGYRVQKSRTITPNLWTLLQLRTLRSEATRGTPSRLWAVAPVDDKASPSVPSAGRGTLRRAALIALMVPLGIANRLIDALGWGDSLMVELKPVERT